MLTQNANIKALQSLRITQQMRTSLQILQMPSDELIAYLEKCSIENPYLILPSSPRSEFDWAIVYEKTLQEHLFEQLALSPLTANELEIAYYLTYNLDDRGFLLDPLPYICKTLHITISQLEKVLNHCYQLEPSGCYASNLTECFVLQLQAINKCDHEMELIVNQLNQIAALGVKDFAKKNKLLLQTVLDKLAIIKTLNPSPGSSFAHDKSLAQEPDIHIFINQQQKVEITLNDYYSELIAYDIELYKLATSHSNKTEEQKFNKEKYSEATFLVKAVKQRAATLLKVAQALADVQEDFFYHGISALKPLTLKEIAIKTDLHESTISRIGNKLIDTPFGIKTIKYFFASQLKSNIMDNAFSSTAVKKSIHDLIANEGNKALSDDAIALSLCNKGIKISRRTVAKYREELGIPSSHQRSKLI